MGVSAGEAMRAKFLGLALLEFSRDLLIAEKWFQSGFLERPNNRIGVLLLAGGANWWRIVVKDIASIRI